MPDIVRTLPMLKFDPTLKHALWGGRRLGTLLSKNLGPHDDYAESWEISDLPGWGSRITDGPLSGTTLRQLMTSDREALLGVGTSRDIFPLLVKFLDAHRTLSVQVHPGRKRDGTTISTTAGKAEFWAIVHAEPGSQVFAGLKDGVDEQALRRAINDDNILDCLHHVAVEVGDCLFIEPGTIHSLGAGIVVAEIQQPNDVTFRLHDWNRIGPDGQRRELHLEQALQATDFDICAVEKIIPMVNDAGAEVLIDNEYFSINRYTGLDEFDIADDDRAHVLVQLAGESTVSHESACTLCLGETAILPANRQTTHIAIPNDGVMLDAFVRD